MGKNKNNQKPEEKPATEVTDENQVTENVEQTEEATEETAEEAAEEAAEETSEEATEEATEEAAEEAVPTVSEQLKEKCEVVIKAKGTPIKMMREVYFTIESDPQKRVNLIKAGDTAAARDIVKNAAEKFLRECTKK